MTPIRSVLAATDFSDPARHALERAAQLAAAHPGATLTLTHVVSSSMLARLRGLMLDETPAVGERVVHEAQQALDDLAARLRKQHACPVATRLSEGQALNDIPEIAAALNADLVVMGARGMHFVHELLIGSTTERVLRKLRRPLLAVKQRPRGAYRRALVPVDFSPHAEAAAMAAHAWLPDADIVLLHAFGTEMESTLRFASVDEARIQEYRARAREAAIDSMEQFIGRLAIPRSKLTREVVHGVPTLQILEHEESLDSDLIVMGKHGQSPMEELLIGSVTKYVLTHSSNDVLVIGQPV